MDSLNPQTVIFLVGFMGSGKSTVGPALAEKLGRGFYDLDRFIEARVGSTIAEFIIKENEEKFRNIETLALREFSDRENAVIAPGGGAITREENRAIMSSRGIVIWLDAPFELCWKRILADGNVRPLAPDEATARERYENRLPLYRRSDMQLPIDEAATPQAVSEAILQRFYNNYER